MKENNLAGWKIIVKERTIAIITARGGSKRIPGKNIKEFCGKPIIVYSIEAAFASGCFDRVMVSTDDAQIARLRERTEQKCRFCGAREPRAIFRQRRRC